MLPIVVPGEEYWDERKEEFIYGKDTKLQLEHSLVSISKWEAKWHKPFFSKRKKDEKTAEEALDYIKCMTLTQNVDPSVYRRLTQENYDEINKYIHDSMTATWFREDKKKSSGGSQVTTSEQFYSWMVKFGIPFECQKWHINRLITLIRVCEEDSKPPQKMSKNKLASSRTALNAARKKQLRTRG